MAFAIQIYNFMHATPEETKLAYKKSKLLITKVETAKSTATNAWKILAKNDGQMLSQTVSFNYVNKTFGIKFQLDVVFVWVHGSKFIFLFVIGTATQLTEAKIVFGRTVHTIENII